MSVEFKIGDKVHLKSGGPLMAVELVEKLRDMKFAHCRWFKENQAQNDIFPTNALVLADEFPSLQIQTESEHQKVSINN